MSNLAEPGFWIIIAIPLIGLLQVIGAALARPHYRRLNQIADTVLSDPQSNDADRSWLKSQLSDATLRWPVWLMAVGAPVIGIAGLVSAVAVLRDQNDTPADWDEFDRRAAKAEGLGDPSGGVYWSTPLRSEMRDAVFNAQVLASPLLSAWIALWLIPALLLLVACGAATLAASQMRHLVEEWALKARSSTLRV